MDKTNEEENTSGKNDETKLVENDVENEEDVFENDIPEETDDAFYETVAGEEDKPEDKEDKKDKIIKRLEKKYNKLVERNKTLDSKIHTKAELTPEQKKEQEAEAYIDRLIEKRLETQKQKERENEEKAKEQFDEELDEVLEETDFKEDQILDVCEDLKVRPREAVKILEKYQKVSKPKPKLPSSKRRATEPSKPDEKKSENMSWEDIKRKALEKIKN